MSIKIICKSLLLALLLSLIVGLLGCQKVPKTAKHELSEITTISISCGHMDRSYGYYFWAHKEENAWFFDAECFTHNFEAETVLENCELNDEDAEALFEILEQSESIVYVENYRKPKKLPIQVSDETTYSFCLTFSDGNQYVTYGRQNDLEEFFYRLAKKIVNK